MRRGGTEGLLPSQSQQQRGVRHSVIPDAVAAAIPDAAIGMERAHMSPAMRRMIAQEEKSRASWLKVSDSDWGGSDREGLPGVPWQQQGGEKTEKTIQEEVWGSIPDWGGSPEDLSVQSVCPGKESSWQQGGEKTEKTIVELPGQDALRRLPYMEARGYNGVSGEKSLYPLLPKAYEEALRGALYEREGVFKHSDRKAIISPDGKGSVSVRWEKLKGKKRSFLPRVTTLFSRGAKDEFTVRGKLDANGLLVIDRDCYKNGERYGYTNGGSYVYGVRELCGFVVNKKTREIMLSPSSEGSDVMLVSWKEEP